MPKFIAVTILVLILHVLLTMFMYHFFVDLISKFPVKAWMPYTVTFLLHIFTILIYNGCPLTYLVDVHIFDFFGIETGIDEYSIGEMWLSKIAKWLVSFF